MTNFSFDVEGLDEVTNKILRMSEGLPQVAARGIFKWAQGTRAILKSTPYPGKNTKKAKWASEKQRRYVMAAIRRGEIQVPYRRTGNLANRWKAVRTTTGAYITNTAQGARYVVGDARGYGQNKNFHEGRWWKANEVIDREATERLPGYVAEEIVKEWRK